MIDYSQTLVFVFYSVDGATPIYSSKTSNVSVTVGGTVGACVVLIIGILIVLFILRYIIFLFLLFIEKKANITYLRSLSGQFTTYRGQLKCVITLYICGHLLLFREEKRCNMLFIVIQSYSV